MNSLKKLFVKWNRPLVLAGLYQLLGFALIDLMVRVLSRNYAVSFQTTTRAFALMLMANWAIYDSTGYLIRKQARTFGEGIRRSVLIVANAGLGLLLGIFASVALMYLVKEGLPTSVGRWAFALTGIPALAGAILALRAQAVIRIDYDRSRRFTDYLQIDKGLLISLLPVAGFAYVTFTDVATNVWDWVSPGDIVLALFLAFNPSLDWLQAKLLSRR